MPDTSGPDRRPLATTAPPIDEPAVPRLPARAPAAPPPPDALSDHLARDRLPPPGVDSAAVQSASYRVRSGPAVGGLVGDITVDHATGTFRFQGAADTDLAGIEIVGDAAGRYSTDHPFQRNEWVATVLPLPAAVDDPLLSVWVDGDEVIRGLDSAAAELRWVRITYSGDTVTIEFPLT